MQEALRSQTIFRIVEYSDENPVQEPLGSQAMFSIVGCSDENHVQEPFGSQAMFSIVGCSDENHVQEPFGSQAMFSVEPFQYNPSRHLRFYYQSAKTLSLSLYYRLYSN